MSFSDLPSFLKALERARELKRVTVEVDPELEITEIVQRVVRQEGPALLFQKVKGSPYPLAINLFGSARRIELALGRSPAELGEEFRRLVELLQGPRWLTLWKARRELRRALRMRPGRAWRVPAQTVVEDPELGRLPILKCWPKDASRFITCGLVFTHHPTTQGRNVGLYRLQVLSPSTTGMHWQIQKGGGFHYAEAERRGVTLPAAVVIGADPYLLMAAVAPLPEGMDEVAFSGFLRGGPLAMARGRSLRMKIPANAEFVLEGEVQPLERAVEGPFGDHFGHYSGAAPFPVFRIRKVTRKANPIFLAAVVGKPPQEDRYLGEAMQEVMGPLLKALHPEVEDLWAYYETGFHNLLVASVHQRYGKEPIKTALGLLGEGQLSLTKCLILVDPQVNPRDFHAVLQAIQQNFDASEDVLLLPGTPLDTLDFTSYTMNLGSKIILDATRKPKARSSRKWVLSERDFHSLKEKDHRISGWRFWEESLLVVQVKSDGREVLENLVRDPALEGIKWVAVVSPDVDLESLVSTLWGIFTRFDAARDVLFTGTHLVGSVARHSGICGLDATWKSGYPEPLEMSEEIREKVDARWASYGI
jgi:4-hydroxybenzoate decarboxylase subunit C